MIHATEFSWLSYIDIVWRVTNIFSLLKSIVFLLEIADLFLKINLMILLYNWYPLDITLVLLFLLWYSALEYWLLILQILFLFLIL